MDDVVAISPMVTGQAQSPQKRDRSPQRGANMSPAVSPAHKVVKHKSAGSKSSSSSDLSVTSGSHDSKTSDNLSVSEEYTPSCPPSACPSLISQSTQKTGESSLGSDDIFQEDADAPIESDQCIGTDDASVTGSKSSAESQGRHSVSISGSQSGPMHCQQLRPSVMQVT